MASYGLSENIAEAERRKKEEAERQAKLDEIAEKQRRRMLELEEKERREKEEILRRPMSVLPKPAEPPTLGRPTELGGTAPVPAAAAGAPSAGKYVPRHLRGKVDGAGQGPPPETDKWGGGPGSKPDDRPSWRDERRPTSFGSSGSRTSWSSSRR